MIRKVIKLSVLAALLLGVAFSTSSCFWGVDPWFSFGIPFLGLPFALISLAVYFLPIIIAAARHSRHMVGIILLNVLAGWTFIGWIIALVWSISSDTERRTG